MNSELEIKPETDLALVPQYHAVAVNATEMANTKTGIKKWLEAKVQSIDAEIVQLQETLDAAIRHKWKSSGFKSQLQREKGKQLYYHKLLAAVHAGYTVVPNMPVDIFAIRVKRDKPAVTSAMRSETYKPSVPSLNNEQEQRLPVGEGQYKSPVQTTNIERWESKNLKNETVHHVMQTPVDFADIEFPLAVAHPVVMDATAAAMALKIFDRIGVVRNGSGDPIVLGEITRKVGWQTKTASFLIAWYLDVRTL